MTKDNTEKEPDRSPLELYLSLLIDNTDDYIWCIDNNKKVVAANRTYRKSIKYLTGAEWHPGDAVILSNLPAEITQQWDNYYTRALNGETFSIESQFVYDNVLAQSEITFSPIIENNEVIAVACYGKRIEIIKDYEERLLKSEQKYKILFESNPMTSWIYERDTLRFLDVNTAAIALYGYSREEFLSMTIKDIRPDEEVARLLEFTRQSKLIDFQKRGEWKHRKKNGDVIDVEIMSHHLVLDGTPVVLVTTKDITKEKKAEEMLALSRAEMETLLNNTLESFMLLDTDLNVVSFNKQASEGAKRLLKLDVEKGMSIFRFAKPDRVEYLKTIYRKVLQGETHHTETYVDTGQNTERVLYNHIKPIHDDSGTVTGVFITSLDITEKKKAENKLLESYENLKIAAEKQSSILDALPANIALLDKDGVIVAVNQSWKTFGNENALCSTQFCVGDNYVVISQTATGEQKEDGQRIADGIKKVINRSLPYFEMEYPCHSPTQQRWFKAEIAPLMKEGISGAVVMHIDISDRKKIELEIQSLNQSLESKVKERTEDMESFAYSVSHDLRAPLRIIEGFSHILVEEHSSVLNEDAMNLIDLIRNSAQRMDLLIQDLLKLSRLGKVEMTKGPTDMNELVSSTIIEVRMAKVGQEQTVIETHELPEALADKGLLKQVWTNLISNAVKYSAKTPNPKVEIGCIKKDEKDVFFVRDNGIGFEIKYADKLFKLFQRLHSNSDFEGTGVGLVIVSRIVKRHGGKIWAESEPGKGATFYFSLQ